MLDPGMQGDAAAAVMFNPRVDFEQDELVVDLGHRHDLWPRSAQQPAG